MYDLFIILLCIDIKFFLFLFIVFVTKHNNAQYDKHIYV